MLPFRVVFGDDTPDLPVWATDEAHARELGREEYGAEHGFDATPAQMAVFAADVSEHSVTVTVRLDDPAAADQVIRDNVKGSFSTGQMRLGSGEILCGADDEDEENPGTFRVSVPVLLVDDPDGEPAEERVADAAGIIEYRCGS